MAANSKIEWTHHTFNPWRGCTKVSAGCANCYAETMSGRNHKTLGMWGPNGTRVVASEAMWREPLKWDRAAKAAGERHRVFCASLADVFEDWQGVMEVSEKWPGPTGDGLKMRDVRRRLFELIDATPNLDWLLLTKRPENVLRMLPPLPMTKVLGAYTAMEVMTRPNVWIGTSVENQAAADERIPHLLKVPAAVRFLSCEPLLGPVNLTLQFADGATRNTLDGQFRGLRCKGENGNPDFIADTEEPKLPKVDWVIVGGESGRRARPMNPDWARSLRDQCQAAWVAFFFKQWGEHVGGIKYGRDDGGYIEAQNGITYAHQSATNVLNWDAENNPGHEDNVSLHVGKKAAGRMLDGREWNELPKGAATNV